MDDRRFDSLVKALARGGSRRGLLKGLLGLGGAAAIGGALLERETDAARRPTPTPKPVKCPGKQTPVNGVCTCPSGLNKCGPDCCNPSGTGTAHSECCDNACCFGTCYGEELCCPTNPAGDGLLPTHQLCVSTAGGTECCAFGLLCCVVDGCCETACTEDGRCCAPENVCPGGAESPDLCCVNDLTTSSVCCGAGTNENACYEAVVGTCCTDADCADPCQVCDLDTHLCATRCDLNTETCCTNSSGGVQCVTGECCIDGEPGCEDSVCCSSDGGTVCLESCEPQACAACTELGVDCCLINGAFVACVDLTVEGACCTADTCEEFNDFANCLVGACTDFMCEQRSACLATQNCCDGECSDEDCPPTCANPPSCAAGQTCCSGFSCCNGSCIAEGNECGPA